MKPNCFGKFTDECRKSECVSKRFCFLRTNINKKNKKREKIRLENVDIHLNEKLKNDKFREFYEQESTKIGLAQKFVKIREKKNE